ncbi:hypothetical protein BB561_000797 [Smittium simulii]|uniref:PH domain-containing protein n=1 Tax=Smittium simulii TaxID=133385 RepID=A0A2T9YXK3_9FUNG|nr:hypothetical protein BB561_000797 [Smittium simulii]
MNKFRAALGSKSKSQTPTTPLTEQFEQNLQVSGSTPQVSPSENFDTMRSLSVTNPFEPSEQSVSATSQSASLSNTPAPLSLSSKATSNSEYQSSIPISTDKGNTIPANIGSGDDSDLVIQRLQAWKHIVKIFSGFLTAFAESAMSQTKSIMKVEQTMRLNAVDSQFFLPSSSGGIIDLFEGVIAENKALASRNAAISKIFTDELVPNLQALRKEIKTQVKTYSSNVAVAVSPANKYQKQIEDESAKLSRAVDNMYKQIFKVDPWLCKQAIEQIILKKVGADNVYYNTIQSEVAKIGNFDLTLSERFAKIVIAYTTHLGEKLLPSDINTLSFLDSVKKMSPSLEWNAFLLKYDSALKEPCGKSEHVKAEDVEYAHKNSKYVQVIKTDQIEREKGLIKSFTRANIVITHCGFLHSFSKNDPEMIGDPDITLVLTKATVETGLNNTFTVKIPSGYSGKGTHSFRCLTQSAVAEWVAAIQSRIENLAFTIA